MADHEYHPDPLIDEEIDQALLRDDPSLIWAATGILATMDEEQYQFHRSAIKARFNGRMPLAALDKAVSAKRNEMRKQKREFNPTVGPETPPNDLAFKILKKHQIINADSYLYEYVGTHWKLISPARLKALAMQYDKVEHTTMRRRAEIASFISDHTHRSSQKWRQIESYEVPVANGVIDIRSMAMRPHRPEDFLQACVPVAYHKDSPWDQLEGCMETYFGADDDWQEKMLALQEFFGYCLMPHAKFKKALLCYGESNCGKSTIPYLLRLLVGAENMCAVSVEDMDDPRKRAPLLGKLINALTELPAEAMIADGGFKTLVSTEEPIQIDPKYLPPIMDVPICKHVIVTNTLPKINDRSKGTFNRLMLIHFLHEIAEKDQDRGVWDRLKSQTEGLLVWALVGAQRLHLAGGSFTKVGAAEMGDYIADQNPFSRFVAEKCEAKAEESSFLHDIRTQFETWYGQRVRPQYLAALIRSAGYHIATERTYVGTVRGFLVKGIQL